MTKFDDVIKSGFWVIPKKYISVTLCKPIDGIVNYPTFICPFQSGKCGKEVEKLKKLNISRRKSSGPTSGYCEAQWV